MTPWSLKWLHGPKTCWALSRKAIIAVVEDDTHSVNDDLLIRQKEATKNHQDSSLIIIIKSFRGWILGRKCFYQCSPHILKAKTLLTFRILQHSQKKHVTSSWSDSFSSTPLEVVSNLQCPTVSKCKQYNQETELPCPSEARRSLKREERTYHQTQGEVIVLQNKRK